MTKNIQTFREIDAALKQYFEGEYRFARAAYDENANGLPYNYFEGRKAFHQENERALETKLRALLPNIDEAWFSGPGSVIESVREAARNAGKDDAHKGVDLVQGAQRAVQRIYPNVSADAIANLDDDNKHYVTKQIKTNYGRTITYGDTENEQSHRQLLQQARGGRAPAAKPAAPAPQHTANPNYLEQALNEIVGQSGKGLMNPVRNDHDAIRAMVTQFVHENAAILNKPQAERDKFYADLLDQFQHRANGGDAPSMAAGYAIDVFRRAVELEKAHKQGKTLPPLTRDALLHEFDVSEQYITGTKAWKDAHPAAAAAPAAGAGAGSGASAAGGAVHVAEAPVASGASAPATGIASGLTPDQIKQIQFDLESLGYDTNQPGGFDASKGVAGMDGKAGRVTRPSMEKFLKDNNLGAVFNEAAIAKLHELAEAKRAAAPAAAAGTESLATVAAGLKDAQGNALSSEDVVVYDTQEFKNQLAQKDAITQAAVAASPTLANDSIKADSIAKISQQLQAAGVEADKISKITATINVDAQGHVTSDFLEQVEKLAGFTDANKIFDARDAALLADPKAIGLIAGAIKSGQLSV